MEEKDHFITLTGLGSGSQTGLGRDGSLLCRGFWELSLDNSFERCKAETSEIHSLTCLAISCWLAVSGGRLHVASLCCCLGFRTVWWTRTSPLSSGAAQHCKGKRLCQQSGNHVSSCDLDSKVTGLLLSSALPDSRGEEELDSAS